MFFQPFLKGVSDLEDMLQILFLRGGRVTRLCTGLAVLGWVGMGRYADVLQIPFAETCRTGACLTFPFFFLCFASLQEKPVGFVCVCLNFF